MSQKQNPLDLGMFAAGLAMIIGSFSPWISVAIVSVSGTDGWRGYVTLVSGLIIALNAATRLWPKVLDERFASKLGLLSNIALASSFAVLVEVAIRINQVAGQMEDVGSTQQSTQSSDDIFGDITKAFDEFAKSLSEAFKPRLAIGWYLCLLSVLACGVVVVLAKRKVQTESLDV
jgi:hypothetical protein